MVQNRTTQEPSVDSPHRVFWERMKQGGRVWRDDASNGFRGWLTIEDLGGDANNIQKYGYKDLKLMLSFEVTAKGFEANSDATDNRVFWVNAPNAEAVTTAIAGTGAGFHGHIDAVSDIDFVLPEQAILLHVALAQFEDENRLRTLEAELLACFNDQQEMEGFTVSDDSDEIYVAKNGRDELFMNWVKDCQLEEAIEYRDLLVDAGTVEYGSPSPSM